MKLLSKHLYIFIFIYIYIPTWNFLERWSREFNDAIEPLYFYFLSGRRSRIGGWSTWTCPGAGGSRIELSTALHAAKVNQFHSWPPAMHNFLIPKDKGFNFHFVYIMVLLLNGNSEIGRHVSSNLCYVICLRHSLDREQTQIVFFQKRPIFDS